MGRALRCDGLVRSHRQARAQRQGEVNQMRHIAALALTLFAGPLATQVFHATGRTLYAYGEPSWGYWRIAAGRYCSQWPPATDWDCYDVFHDGARGVRFVDDWDNESIGAFDE